MQVFVLVPAAPRKTLHTTHEYLQDSMLRNVTTILITLVKERDIPEHLQALDSA
jgi:hypothetical protein